MLGLIRLIFGLVVDLFRSRAALAAEILVLRQQITVLRRGRPTRLTFRATDKSVLGCIWLFPNARAALAVVRPETVMRWHRAGFRSYWRWKSRGWPGRPALPTEIRKLIREMSVANSLWGAPRIHGELLKLGIDVGRPASPSTWSGRGDLRLKVGRPFSVIMRTALPRWTCLWCRPFRSGCYTAS
jgi:hypothetical protein